MSNPLNESPFLKLVPTPICDELPIEALVLAEINTALVAGTALLVVEESKVARKKWLAWGGAREAIAQFVELNEQNWQVATAELLDQLLTQGKNLYLMSDGGLPGVCDPGTQLIAACHQNQIRVTSFAFANSIMLAVALSGMDCRQFYFRGFLPVKDMNERQQQLRQILTSDVLQVVMDTPYRLERLLSELMQAQQQLPVRAQNHRIFLAMDLNSPQEQLVVAPLKGVGKRIGTQKREFILLISR